MRTWGVASAAHVKRHVEVVLASFLCGGQAYGSEGSVKAGRTTVGACVAVWDAVGAKPFGSLPLVERPHILAGSSQLWQDVAEVLASTEASPPHPQSDYVAAAAEALSRWAGVMTLVHAGRSFLQRLYLAPRSPLPPCGTCGEPAWSRIQGLAFCRECEVW